MQSGLCMTSEIFMQNTDLQFFSYNQILTARNASEPYKLLAYDEEKSNASRTKRVFDQGHGFFEIFC